MKNKKRLFLLSVLSMFIGFSTTISANQYMKEEDFELNDIIDPGSVSEEKSDDTSFPEVEIEYEPDPEPMPEVSEQAFYAMGGIGEFAAPSGGPYFGWYTPSSASSTVNIYLSSNSTSAYTYIAKDRSVGTFPILDEANGRYKIAISELIGWIPKADIQLTKFEDMKGYDHYSVASNGDLIHYISRGGDSTVASPINQGPAPSWMTKGIKYLSFDGHYFYTASSLGLTRLINDYNPLNSIGVNANNSHPNSLNPKTPFYNYFQWLPIRTQTNISASAMSQYINNNKNKYSKLSGIEQDFIDMGHYYGANAATVMANAIHESNFGVSVLSYDRNNFFGHNAVDSNPNNATLYNTPLLGVDYHYAAYINGGYLDMQDYRWYGSFVGNKDMGMNVKYASDPYWGEKISAHHLSMDRAAGSPDYGRYDIAMVTRDSAPMYKQANMSAEAFKMRYAGVPIAVTEKTTASNGTKLYGVQSDPVLNGSKNPIVQGSPNWFNKYNVANSTVYIKQSDAKMLFTGSNSKLIGQRNTTRPPSRTVSATDTVIYALDTLNLRPDWSTKYASITSVPKNTKLTGKLTDNGWIRVVYNGYIGYLSTDYVSKTQGGKPIGNGGNVDPAPDPKPEPSLPQPGNTSMYVVPDVGLNLRSEPNTSSSTVVTVPKNAEVKVGSTVNGWVHAKYNGKTGYMAVEYLTTKKPGTVNKKGDINGDGKIDAVDMAMMQAHMRGIYKMKSAEFEAADINKDKKIDAVDLAMLQSHMRGLYQIEGW